MQKQLLAGFSAFLTLATAATLQSACGRTAEAMAPAPLRAAHDDPASQTALRQVDEGRRTFRFDTFGDEAFWSGVLRLQEPIAGASPKAALGLGLKVDVDALPRQVVEALAHGKVNLEDPAVTLALLAKDAVVGVKGKVENGTLRSIGITCALCHSTVDDSLAPGVGHRLDGWPNRDLNVGKIVSLSPSLGPVADLLGVDVPTLESVLASWGPGKFDAEVFLDGKAFRPDGKTAATLIPPAFGLAGVNLHTFTGWGQVTYWNAFVANLEMHGQGTFFDPRLDDAAKFPIAARNGFGHVRPPEGKPDLVTPKLPALHVYQLALEAPRPPEGSFDAAAAARGKTVFGGKAKCASCHVPPIFTEPGWNMHTAEELGIDDFQASRSPEGRYRTTPLKGLFAHAKGGFYHDGRFATLEDVVDHYDQHLGLGLTPAQKADLIEYLKSL
jgi:cytochrome c5